MPPPQNERTPGPRSPDHLALGHVMREAREQVGMTQAEVAEQAGVARTAINDLEAGRRNPGFSTMVGVARALRRPLSELISAYEARLRKTR